MRVSSVAVAAGLLSLAPKFALAAECSFDVSARTAVVGQPIIAQLSCDMKDGEAEPTEPKLALKGAANQSGPSRGTSSQVMMHNFTFSKRVSTIFTWTVVPTRPGELFVGPASVKSGPGRAQSDTIQVQVLDGTNPAQVPQRRSPFDFDPFDFMKGSQFPSPRQTGPEHAPSELDVATAPSTPAFLVARSSTKKVVLGEPVHLQVFAYGGLGPFVPISLDEPGVSDFLSFPVENDGQFRLQAAEVGGEEWLTGKLYDVWLIPLRTGKLKIGKVISVLEGRGMARYPRKRLGTTAIVIDVSEPPTLDRPPEYQLGDAGEFALSATLTPRELTSGDYLEVVLTISGKGNPPAKVVMPALAGIEWQEPTSTLTPEIQADSLRGTRVLKYTGRVTGDGTLSLGKARIPYFNVRTRAYEVLEQDLGEVLVHPSNKLLPAPTGPVTPRQASPLTPNVFEQLSPRSDPGKGPLEESFAEPRYWWPLVLLPALAAAFSAWRNRRRDAPNSKAAPRKKTGTYRSHLKDAEVAFANSDPTEGSRALERALFTLLDERLGTGLRGLQKSHLGAELERRGLPKELAGALESQLIALETARYEGLRETAEPLLRSTTELVARIEKQKLTKGAQS